MKKLFLILCLINSFCLASNKLQVEAQEDFSSLFPNKTFQVKLLENAMVDNILIKKDSIINCELKEIKNPSRAKQNAKIFYTLKNYTNKDETFDFNNVYIAKYAKTTLSENKGKIAQKTVTTVGNFFVKGLSLGVSFVEGIKNNEENSRIKSGVKKVYDDSFLSLVEYGEQVEIQKGDVFYLLVKKYDL